MTQIRTPFLHSFVAIALLLGTSATACIAAEYNLTLQRRTTQGLQQENTKWDAAKTAIIICDMWDQHWCAGATGRVGEMAPRMNEVIATARNQGTLIIHAPSACLDAYRDHPARQRALAAPKTKDTPNWINRWARDTLPSEAGAAWPIDQSDGGCDCQPKCQTRQAWQRQIATLGIAEEDAISDSGSEVWNLLKARGIKQVIVVGVHTNMCVIGRPFGLRNLVRSGFQTVLMRDLTDTMYNSQSAPHVSHFNGTELVVNYIERYVCPTITSDQLVGGKPFAFDPTADYRRKP